MKIPNSEDFGDFTSNYHSIYHKPRSLLSAPIEKDEEWKSLENHSTYKWIKETAGFKDAISTLSYKKLIQPNLKNNNYELLLAYICCSAFYIYLTEVQNPGIIKVTNKSLLKRATTPVNKLLALLDKGLQMQNPMETNQLKNLLANLNDEITEKAPTYYPKENKGFLADKNLVVNLYDFLTHYYKEAPTTAIHHIVSIIDENISKRQVERYVSPYREYLEKRKEYEKIREERAGLFGVSISSRQE